MGWIDLIRWLKRIKQTSTMFLAEHNHYLPLCDLLPVRIRPSSKRLKWLVFFFWWCVSVKDISVTFPFKRSSRRGEKLPIWPLSALIRLLWWWKSGLRARKEHTSACLHANHQRIHIPHTQLYRIIWRHGDATNKEPKHLLSYVKDLC